MTKNHNFKQHELKRKVKAQDKGNYDFMRDTEAALARRSELTPLQLQRLEKSVRVKDSKKQSSRFNAQAEMQRLSGLSSSEFNANP